MGSDLHHPWVREETLREEHKKRVAELEAEVDLLRPFEVALRELVESIDAEHRTFESTQRNDPARTAAVAASDRALVAARALTKNDTKSEGAFDMEGS